MMSSEPDDETQKYLRDLEDPDPETRAFAAFNLLTGPATEEVLAALRARLGDEDHEVRGFAAQSLGHLADLASLPAILELVERDPATEPRPEPLAAARLAMLGSEADRARVVEALMRFADRGGQEAKRQTELLLARMDRR